MNSTQLSIRGNMVVVACAAATAVLLSGCSPDPSVADRLQRAERQLQSESYVNAEIELLNALKLDPRNKSALALLGIISQRQGQWSKAMAFLPKAKLGDTNRVDVRRALALTYVNVRNFPRAREEAEFVLGRSPDDDTAVFVLVDSARSKDEMESARRLLEKLQQQAGDRSIFRVGLGELSLRGKDLKAAETHLGRALDMDARSGMAHATMAGVYFARGDRTNATRSLQKAAELAPARSFIRMKWADYLVEIARVEEARQFLEQNIRDTPGYVPAMTRLAQIAFDQRKYDECATLLRRVLTAEPLNFEGLLLNSKTHLARNEPKKAADGFERMATLYSKAPAVHFQLGLAYLVGGNLAKGLASLNKAVTLEPGYSEAVLLLADLQLRSGDAFSAISSISGLLKKRPNLMPAHLALAEAYRVRGTLDDTVAVYRRLMELHPENPEPPFLLGVTLRQQKKLGEARKAFSDSLAIEPAFLRAVIQLVEMDIEGGNVTAALERAQRYANRYATRAEPQWLLAQVHLTKPDNARAEQALHKAIELDRDFGPAYVALARLMSASGRRGQAVERLEALLVRNPKDAVALLLLAMVHEQSGDVSRAQATYNRLLEINPDHAAALNNAACLYAYRLGDIERGLELARRAREQSPYDPFTADTLGWILHLRGDYATALGLLEESARQLSFEPEVLFHLGMTHYMLGEETPALTFLERAVQSKKVDSSRRGEALETIALIKLDPATVGPEAIKGLEQRVIKRPGDPVAATRLAAVYARAGDPDKAIGVCERALRTNPEVVRLHVQLAELYSEHRRDPGRALEYARAARQRAPDDPRVASELGRVAFQSRDYKWAYHLLNDAVRKHSDDSETLAAAGWAAYSVGRLSEAESFVQRASKAGLSPASSNAVQRFLAMSALVKNPATIAGAAIQIQSVLSAHPNDVPTLMVVGLAHRQGGRLDDARKVYERVLALYPEFTPAMQNLASIYVEQGGNDQRAFELASMARETITGNPDLSRTLGILAYRRGEFSTAVRLLKEVSIHVTNDAPVFFHLGMAHHRLGEYREGGLALRRALEMDSRSPLATEARKVMSDAN